MTAHPNGRRAATATAILSLLASAALLVGCASPTPTATPQQSPTPSPSAVAAACAPNPDIPAPDPSAAFDQALHDELIDMLARDQQERTGETDAVEGDEARTERLKAIVAERGWPTIPMVGEDGEDAAWAIAQHSDLDPDFQCIAVELLRIAVAAGVASGGNLAYLQDRVAVAAGKPQTYGTQIGCGEDGAPVPSTPIADEATIDALRAEVGLAPLAEYYAEMAELCAGRRRVAQPVNSAIARWSKARSAGERMSSSVARRTLRTEAPVPPSRPSGSSSRAPCGNARATWRVAGRIHANCSVILRGPTP